MEWNTDILIAHSGQNDDKTSIVYDDSTHITLSNPDEQTSSGIESFDEDDMYGSDNSDDIIVLFSDSDSNDDAQTSIVGIFDDVTQDIRMLCTELESVTSMARALYEARKTTTPTLDSSMETDSNTNIAIGMGDSAIGSLDK
ncbi:hypothetical protein EI94DRAFT_1708006 [Lactarius quietus]|nr:hypothetical protein EI94DRAFT_1708006 [Lactarius quietus]